MRSSGRSISSSERAEKSSGMQGNKFLVEIELADLAGTLPAWMKEKGMVFEDQREVFGYTVLRSRVRHEWTDGKEMEIEVSDLGSGVDEKVIKALGFDLEIESVSDESGFQEGYDDGGDVLTNYEYNYADQAGSLQVILGDRYLIEIQLQGLPEEAFQEILDQDIAFDELYKE